MLVRNKKTGDVEGMGFDEANSAVNAGTHAHVNLEQKDGELVAKPDKAKQANPPEPDASVSGDAVVDPAVREVETQPKKAR